MKSGKLVQRVLIAVAAVSFIAVAAIFIGYRQFTQKPEQVIDLVHKAAEMHLDKVRQTASKNGIKEWQLEAASATLLDGKTRVVLEAPDVAFFMSDGDNVHLTAKRGNIFTDSSRMTVAGDVVASTRQYRFSSDALEYDPASRELRSDTPVTLTGKTFSLKADHMAMNLDTRVTRFEGGVQGTISDAFQL